MLAVVVFSLTQFWGVLMGSKVATLQWKSFYETCSVGGPQCSPIEEKGLGAYPLIQQQNKPQDLLSQAPVQALLSDSFLTIHLFLFDLFCFIIFVDFKKIYICKNV